MGRPTAQGRRLPHYCPYGWGLWAGHPARRAIVATLHKAIGHRGARPAPRPFRVPCASPAYPRPFRVHRGSAPTPWRFGCRAAHDSAAGRTRATWPPLAPHLPVATPCRPQPPLASPAYLSSLQVRSHPKPIGTTACPPVQALAIGQRAPPGQPQRARPRPPRGVCRGDAIGVSL